MVNIDNYPGFTLRYLHVECLRMQGFISFGQPMLVAESNDEDGLYYAVFADTGIGHWINKHTFEKTRPTESEAKLVGPSYLNWRQREAIGYSKNPFLI
ncbi:TPA: hypothetical protein J5G41_003887 [Escherichia coli]|nr:hypothetical protein [Escherichia coli]HBA4352449.1 hypothetical protein [Escherichia coli]